MCTELPDSTVYEDSHFVKLQKTLAWLWASQSINMYPPACLGQVVHLSQEMNLKKGGTLYSNYKEGNSTWKNFYTK